MISAVLLVICAAVSAEESATGTELDQYLAEAARNHPGLQMRHADWLAALERIPQATALDDPMFEYAQVFNSDDERLRIGINQMFPWFGTLRERGDQAAAEADAALSRFFAERDAMFLMVKEAYYDYAFLAEQIRIVDAQIGILSYVEEVITIKLSLGLATDDELLRVGIAKTDLVDRRNGLEQMRPALSAELSTALGRKESGLIEWPTDASVPALDYPGDFDTVFSRVKAGNPTLAEFDGRLAALEHQEALAKKAGLPNIGLGFEWTNMKSMKVKMQETSMETGGEGGAMKRSTRDVVSELLDATETRYEGGDDEFMLELSFSVPLWRKKVKAGIQEARHMQRAVEQEKHARALELESAARMSLFEIQDAARRYALMRDSLIPQAQQTYESLVEKYAADALGKTFIDILDSVQMLLDFQLEQAHALVEWKKGIARVEFLIGAGREAPEVPK